MQMRNNADVHIRLTVFAPAVTPIYAVRDLKQFTVGNQMTFQQPHQLVHTHMQAKKDVAMHMIDHAKSFAHDMSKGKGKGAPVVASLPTTYVVTSQPQIVVAPMPQLAPTPVVASAPQVQAPAPPPPPPEIRYVPVSWVLNASRLRRWGC